MSIEINPPMSLHAQSHVMPATHDKGTDGDVIGQMNVAVTKMPSGEHGNRLHAQVTSMQKAEHVQTLANSIATNSSRGSGLAGQSGISNLNLLPSTLSALHVAVNNNIAQSNKTSEKSENSNRSHKIPSQESHEDQHSSENSGESEGYENSFCEIEEIEIEIVSQVEKKRQFEVVYNALVIGEQFSLIKQLKGERRILVVFPVIEAPKQIRLRAQAYLLWFDNSGCECITSFDALIVQTEKVSRSDNKWVSACGYKDRAAYSRWQLKMQSTFSNKVNVSFHIGNTRLLPAVWNDVNVTIFNAFRFWLTLGNQVSLLTVISNKPLVWWNSQ